jgi:hypothetical protein
MEHHSLRDLVGLLDRRGETRLYAPMLDMYSRHSVLESIVPPGKRLVDVAPHFDPFTDGEFTFYECIRLRGRPAMLGYNRARVFGNLSIAADGEKPIGFHMEKFPLSKWNDRTAYCCVHCPFPFTETPLLLSECSFIFGLSGSSSSSINHALSFVRHGTVDLHTRHTRINLNRILTCPFITLTPVFTTGLRRLSRRVSCKLSTGHIRTTNLHPLLPLKRTHPKIGTNGQRWTPGLYSAPSRCRVQGALPLA